MWAKHVIDDFDFFDPLISLRGAQDNLEVEKVLVPSKNIEKSPLMCFAVIQKMTSQTIRIFGAFVLLCPCETIWPKKFF
jgi:hypothetical protein